MQGRGIPEVDHARSFFLFLSAEASANSSGAPGLKVSGVYGELVFPLGRTQL